MAFIYPIDYFLNKYLLNKIAMNKLPVKNKKGEIHERNMYSPKYGKYSRINYLNFRLAVTNIINSLFIKNKFKRQYERRSI